ncbi:MAG: ABC transporter substrate-binding protein [bacterium]
MRASWMICAALITALVVGLPTVRAQADLVTAAKKEGRLAVYGSMESDIFSVVQKIYEGKYGVPLDYWRASSTVVMDRVMTEVRAGKPLYDVAMTNRSPMLILKRGAAFGKYVSPSYEAFPPGTIDKDGVLSPSYRIVVVSILYNTRLVKPEDAPKTYADLLDPKWKGKIVMPDPTQHTTTATWVMNLEKAVGRNWREYVERLAGQVGLVESFLPAVNKVITGEFPLGLTYVKYVHVFGKEGAPLDYVRLSPVLAETHHVALGAKALHPNAGKLFIDMFTSRLGLLALAQAGEFVLVPGIYPPIKDADKLRIAMMEDLDEQEIKKFRDDFGRFFLKR